MIRRTFSLVAKIAVTLALGAWLCRSIDLGRMWHLTSALGARPFASALALLVVQGWLMSVRWRRVLRLYHCTVGPSVALRWVFVGLFFNQALPTSVGGDAVRMWLLRRGALTEPGTAFASVAIERATGIALLGLMVSACVPPYWHSFDRPLRAALVGAGPALLILLVLLAFADRWSLAWMPPQVVRALGALSRGLRKLAQDARAMAVVVAFGLASSLCGLLSAYLLGRELGAEIAFGGVIVALGGSILVSALPVSIGGWGVREASLVATYGALGVAPESALAVSLLVGLTQLVVSLPGGWLWWRELSPARAALEDAAS